MFWNAKRGMKPGDDARSEPSIDFLFLRRRQRKPHANSSAARPKMPTGMPTPNPIFWVRVSPASAADGASGSAATLGLAVDLDVVDLVEEILEAEECVSDVVDDAEDGDAVEADALLEDRIDVDKVVPDDAEVRTADDRVARLGLEDGAERVGREDCDAGVETGTEDCTAVVCSAVVCGVAVGHAVSGPNLTIK